MAKRSKVMRTLVVSVVTLAVLAGGGLFALQSWHTSNLEAVSETVVESEFIVSQGESTSQIADRLYNEGFIRNSRSFQWFVSRNEDGSLQAGQYRLSPHLNATEIVEILAGGRVDTRSITVLPGLRLDELQDQLVAEGFEASAIEAALNRSYDHPIFDSAPAGATNEGYIFPETIQITTQTSAEELIERYLDVFYDTLTPEIIQGIEEQGLSLHEAIILASIVQKEIGDPAIQPTVAQVFLRRLNEGEVLGSDVTFFYAAAVLGVDPAIDLDSPYNTRIFGGLPPGPISNFNLSALEAVANPSDTDYLFFVAGDDGITYFANTLAEHEANVSAHCIELCKL